MGFLSVLWLTTTFVLAATPSLAPAPRCDACRLLAESDALPSPRVDLTTSPGAAATAPAPGRHEPTLVFYGGLIALGTSPFLVGSVPLLVAGANAVHGALLLAAGIACAAIGLTGLAALVVAYVAWRMEVSNPSSQPPGPPEQRVGLAALRF